MSKLFLSLLVLFSSQAFAQTYFSSLHLSQDQVRGVNNLFFSGDLAYAIYNSMTVESSMIGLPDGEESKTGKDIYCAHNAGGTYCHMSLDVATGAAAQGTPADNPKVFRGSLMLSQIYNVNQLTISGDSATAMFYGLKVPITKQYGHGSYEVFRVKEGKNVTCTEYEGNITCELRFSLAEGELQ